MTPAPPNPGDAHPAYADRPWLVDWLNNPARQHVLVPIRNTRPDAGLSPEHTTLTKQRAWAPAPYVGRPFVYVWPVAVDNQGRAIAGDATIQHVLSETEWAKRA